MNIYKLIVFVFLGKLQQPLCENWWDRRNVEYYDIFIKLFYSFINYHCVPVHFVPIPFEATRLKLLPDKFVQVNYYSFFQL